MKREIKFKRAHFLDEEKKEFSHFTEWGVNIGFAKFTSPSSNNFALYHTDLQFTGLKDKNGVTYCQNDIVRYKNNNYRLMKGSYKFELLGFNESSQDDPSDFFSEKAYLESDIIGNIYENPKLLESAIQ